MLPHRGKYEPVATDGQTSHALESFRRHHPTIAAFMESAHEKGEDCEKIAKKQIEEFFCKIQT